MLSVLESPSEPSRTISCDIQVRTAAQEYILSSSKAYTEAVLPDLLPQPTFLLALLCSTLGLSGVENKDYQINSLIAATGLFLSKLCKGWKGI